jgi:hypothetical protein
MTFVHDLSLMFYFKAERDTHSTDNSTFLYNRFSGEFQEIFSYKQSLNKKFPIYN